MTELREGGFKVSRRLELIATTVAVIGWLIGLVDLFGGVDIPTGWDLWPFAVAASATILAIVLSVDRHASRTMSRLPVLRYLIWLAASAAIIWISFIAYILWSMRNFVF